MTSPPIAHDTPARTSAPSSSQPHGSSRPTTWTSLRIGAWLVSTASLLASAGASAQSDTRAGELVETISVRVVNVDVVVTDRKGRPVEGLEAEDFRIYESGRPVEVSHFYAHGGGDTLEPEEESTPTATAAREQSAFTLALYLDERNLEPNQRARVVQDLAAFLEAQGSGATDLLLFSYGDDLEVLAGPTRDIEVIRAALLDPSLERGGRAMQSRTALRQAMAQTRDAYEACENAGTGSAVGGICVPCDDMWPDMIGYARTYAAGQQARTADGASALAEVVQTLAGLEGRKAVLFLGQGYEQRAGESMFSYLADLCASERAQAPNEVFRTILEYDSTSRLEQLAAFANLHRISLYMLDAGGIRAGQSTNVDFGSTKFRPSTLNDRLFVENLQGTHTFLAEETGGRAILNTQRIGPDLENMFTELGSATYSLGFVPDHPPTGLLYRLRVELVEPGRGWRVRYRKSYVDKVLTARLAERLYSTLILGTEQNPLGVRLSAIPSTDPTDARAVVQMEVPGSELLLVDSGPDAQEGQVRIWLASRDAEGRQSELRQQFVDLGTEGTQPGDDGVYRFSVRMDLEPGTHAVAAGVRDEVTGRESMVRTEVTVPPTG